MYKDVNVALEIRADRLSNLIPHMVGTLGYKFAYAVEHEVTELLKMLSGSDSVHSEIYYCLYIVKDVAIDFEGRVDEAEAQELVKYAQVYADSARSAIYQLRYIEEK